MTDPQRFPGPGKFIPVPDLMALRHSPLEALVTIARTYGDIFRYPVGFWTVYFVNHPDFIRHVLQDNQRNYSKATFQYSLLGGIAGRGLLTNDGESWLQQRRLAQPAFHREQLAALVDAMVQATSRTAGRWEMHARRGVAVDVDAEMMALTLTIVGQSLFGTDFSADADDLVSAVVTALDHVVYRAMNPFALPDRVPTGRNRRYRAAVRRLDRAIYALIAHRRARLGSRRDLLALLMEARDQETGAAMSDRQLRDEIITLVIAGHETVASALTWTLVFLGANPGIQSGARDEVDDVLGGRLPAVTDLQALALLRRVFDETLRMVPPAWIITRRTLGEDNIGGYRVPANALIVMSPYVTHRHPAFWEAPERFDPDRFLPEAALDRPRYAYFPFGGGPRLCIGNQYAAMEAQVVLATLMQRFRVEPVQSTQIAVRPLVTLRPSGPVLMRLFSGD